MKPLLQIKHLTKYYSQGSKLIRAVDDVSFDIYPSKTLGLVGESGCGKTSIARCILQLHSITDGQIKYEGNDLAHLTKKQLKEFRKSVGMIFQDPYASLNPRMSAEEIILEPLQIHKIGNRLEQKKRTFELLDLVGLPIKGAGRFPHEFSGGQRQRIGIARALALNPKLIVCDEPISALDVSVQAQIINLLKKLQREIGLSYLFIAHDLRVVKYLSDQVAVMYLGQVMEIAPSQTLYKKPLHPYTQALLSAIPIPDPKIERKRRKIPLRGEIPSERDGQNGCPFASRCHLATPTCHHVRPPLKKVGGSETEGIHQAACHLL